MKENILIVEDEFIVANDLSILLKKAGYSICGMAASVDKALELVDAKKPDWVLLDIMLQGDKTGIDLAKILMARGIPFIYISANTNQHILEAAKATQPYGFLVKPFREKDLLVMLDIALYRQQQHKKFEAQQKSVPLQQLEDLLSATLSQDEKLLQLAQFLQTILPFEYLNITPVVTDAAEIHLLRSGAGRYQLVATDDLFQRIDFSVRAYKTLKWSNPVAHEKTIYDEESFNQLLLKHRWIKALSEYLHLRSMTLSETQAYHFYFFSTQPDTYTRAQIDAFSLLAPEIAETLHAILAEPGSTPAPTKKVVPASAKKFNGIIGQSTSLLKVFNKIEIVAPDITSVLIIGESGTGKEKVAQNIHLLSPRRSKPMITVNCAALPLHLIESELFGHEKGAFTGANEKRIGKFEQADGGSIFLDEIGELPLEAQVKLLRVLQEKEIERLGGSKTKKIDVRIIAATNRNLEKEVAEDRFRLDLYYRLHVFPIALPALRERKEDIPLLAHHFLLLFAQRSGKSVTTISKDVMQSMMDYAWPGNIRELEHLIERSVLMTIGTELKEIEFPKQPIVSTPPADNMLRGKTMEEMEKEHIMHTLKLCNGKVFGPGGAAEVLNVPPTTLYSKMKKLGIRNEFVK